MIAEIDLDRWFAERLAESGFAQGYNQKELVENTNKFVSYDTGNIRLIFRRLTIEPSKNHVVHAEINFLLEK